MSEVVRYPKRRARPFEEQGAGIVGIVSGEILRYSHFLDAMMFLQLPEGSKPQRDPGANVVGQCNKIIQRTREEDMAWCWIMGDDHFFFPDIVKRLLEREVDVVVPLCLQRSAPFYPVVYDTVDENGVCSIAFDLPETGVHEIVAAGSAGMLVRRHVIDALPEKPFQVWGPNTNEDLEFCKAVREAGFKLWVDVETPLAHVGTMVVWPYWTETNGWQSELMIGPDTRMCVSRINRSAAMQAV